MPTPTIGGGTGRTGRTGASTPRLTWFQWSEARIGKLRVVTPKEGEDAPGIITDAQHVAKALGFDRAETARDVRPVLVYFHWPHDDRTNGKLTTTLCTQVLDDERAARWSKLFRCVQIDMAETELRFAELIGAAGKPAFVALDENLKVVAAIPATKSASKLRKALEAAFKKFPKARKNLKVQLKRQENWLAAARKLEKAEEYEEARELVDKIRFGDVRVGADWDKTYAYGLLLAQKAERQLDGG